MRERFSYRVFSAGLIVLAGAGFCLAAQSTALVPQPKQVYWEPVAPLELKEGGTVIVLGNAAAEAERQGAALLRERVQRRHGQDWPVVTESSIPAEATTLVLLGQRSTNAMLDNLCTKHGTLLSEESPGHDGYVIQSFAENGRTNVLVGGSNARGVIYGQDTLFQTLAKTDGKVVLRPTVVRDWPSVPWRGRPQTHYKHYLEPGAMDCYLTSRINWIDLREGIYAFEPGAKLEKDVLQKVIDEAHKRNLIVYGTVNCGVPASQRSAVLGTFREFIAMGVDGLWLSFDDKGPGEQPEVMVSQVLELGREHGIRGNRIAICPPKGSYQEIDTDFNRKIAAIPGTQEAFWFWTRVPCKDDADLAARIGLNTKPSWWHNWTRPASGMTHIESNSLNAAKRSYMQVPAMAEGWHAPRYEQLADSGPYCEAVMPWGGQGWGQYYIVPVIGWWGWSAEQHDFETTRRRIYDIVYGPGQAQTARRFDDLLKEVKQLFAYPVDSSEWLPLCPPRLKRLSNRNQAQGLLAHLQELAVQLAESAPSQSLLDPEILQEWYLDAMANEVAIGRAEAKVSFPEYWWNDHQRTVLNAIYQGDLAGADAAINGVKERLLREVAEIESELAGLRIIPAYVNWWRQRAELDAQGWQGLVEARREELAARIWWYGYAVHKLGDMLADADSPPLGQGTGRWERQNLVLAAALPAEREQYWGNWMGGLYRKFGKEAAVFAFRHRTEGAIGAFSELPVSLPVSGDRSRLGLMIFLSNVDKDSIGLHYVPRRWSGHRRIQLLNGNEPVWEADLGLPRPDGEWFVVRLPELPQTVKELNFILRVEDLKETRAHAIAFVGPIRLVQLPE